MVPGGINRRIPPARGHGNCVLFVVFVRSWVSGGAGWSVPWGVGRCRNVNAEAAGAGVADLGQGCRMTMMTARESGLVWMA